MSENTGVIEDDTAVQDETAVRDETTAQDETAAQHDLAPTEGDATGADLGSHGTDVDGSEPDGSATDAAAADAPATDAPAAGGTRRSAESAHDLLVAEGDAAGDYLERLLDILDFDGDIDLDVEGERAVVSILGGGDVDRLVGDRGEVLDALQELTRLAALAETGQRSRLMLDIAGYRARRRTELADVGRKAAEEVVASGEVQKLTPMNPFERKIVHDAVGLVEGATSSSEGEEPRRRVVVSPAS